MITLLEQICEDAIIEVLLYKRIDRAYFTFGKLLLLKEKDLVV